MNTFRTNDLATVERWCQEAAWIDAGKIRVTGHPSMVVSEYRRAIALEERNGSIRRESPESERIAPVQIERVQLASSSSSEPAVLGPEDPLQVRVDFKSRNGAVDVGFRIKLSRSDGLTIYEASTLAEPELLPRPLPSSGTLQLQIERLGLAAGTYLVDAIVESAGGQSYGARIQPCTFRVDSDRTDRGIINLPHRWTIGRAVNE